MRKSLFAVGYIIGIALLGLGLRGSNVPLVGRILCAVAGLVVFGWAIRNYNTERKKEAGRANEALANDSRAPVVYLRSFISDQHTAQSASNALVADFAFATEEEQLVAALNEIGPCIAIGRPGEEVPNLGAARGYFADSEWQQGVLNWINKAGLVVLRAGSTEHLFWEFCEVRKSKSPLNVIVIVPNAEAEYSFFRERCLESGIHLPVIETVSLMAGTARGYLRFGSNWEAKYEPFLARYTLKLHLRTRIRRPLFPAYHFGLKPVFQHLKVAWSPLAVSWYVVACYIVTLVFLVFALLKPS